MAYDLGLQNKAALVTLASDGLGLACALRLAEAGCRIAIYGRRVDTLDRARKEIKRRGGVDACGVPADLTDPEAIERCVDVVGKRLGRLDILSVNTDHIAYGALEDLREITGAKPSS